MNRIEYTADQYDMFFSNEEAKYKILPKGRRVGFTRGGTQYYIEKMVEKPVTLLWGDVTYTNIEKYLERYWFPTFTKLGLRKETDYTYSKQEKILKYKDSTCDFRSADYPENWEGFGYDIILLNEAGIILKNDYIWDVAVLPMLMDKSDSKAIIGGTPKGKRHKEKKARFFDLWEHVGQKPNFWGCQYSTYGNTYLDKMGIQEVVEEIPSILVPQEIYGQFIDDVSTLIKPEWIKYTSLDSYEEVAIGVDLAISLKTSADYTSIFVLGKTGDYYYVIDVIRGHYTFNQTKELIEQTAERYKADVIGIESVAYQQAIVQELVRTTSLNVKKVEVNKDKVTRFMPIVSKYEYGYIYHTRKIKDYEDELLSFPEVENDDQCDSFSVAFQCLSKKASFTLL